jgi:hypothetical protein
MSPSPFPRTLAARMNNIVSEQKLAANRRNAQRSTGPKTTAGRAASKMNALKHGLIQEQQAHQDADLLPDQAVLDKILRYETKLERQMYHAMNQLERLQRQRQGTANSSDLSTPTPPPLVTIPNDQGEPDKAFLPNEPKPASPTATRTLTAASREPNPPPDPPSLTVGAQLRAPSQQSRDRQGAADALTAATHDSGILEPPVEPANRRKENHPNPPPLSTPTPTPLVTKPKDQREPDNAFLPNEANLASPTTTRTPTAASPEPNPPSEQAL